jgi:D-beta-D-heptose 7-phosphate kinase/D-beta-D-heptose 1-phosphate adenosyltransferase
MNHFNFVGCRVMVVGDLMLDKYLDGSVHRLSPEAPVAVLLRETERVVLGGAANVVANLASLGADVRVIGVIGDDESGAMLTGLLKAYSNVDTRTIVTDKSRPTTCKTRIMSGLHQIVRVDSESKAELTDEAESAVRHAIQDTISWADVVILSDYAKGLCTDRVIRTVIDLAAEQDKISIIDPKRRDFTIYRNATLIKPNRRELTEATQLPCETDDQAERAALVAMSQTNSAILLSRSEQGMSYFEVDNEPFHLKTAAKNVFDVSGAGDTIVALAALGAAARLPITESMRLANVAAGIVVSKIGTAVVTIEELDDALDAESHQLSPGKGSLLELGEAVRQREVWRKRGLRVGFTNGCYDLLHPGHVSLLKKAAAECDRLIVAINSDASVRRLKGPTRPVQDEVARAYVLGALSAVDRVIVFDEDTPARVIEALKPDLLVKGADYTVEQVVGADIVRAAGGHVLLVPLIVGQSTTSMIRRATSQ